MPTSIPRLSHLAIHHSAFPNVVNGALSVPQRFTPFRPSLSVFSATKATEPFSRDGREKEETDGTIRPPKVSMISLGCPKNTVDGEVLLGDLYRSGFDIAEDAEDADALVVNTCGFVEDAKTESLEAIVEASRLKEEGRVKKIVITGCLAQRYGKELVRVVLFFERGGKHTDTIAMNPMLGFPLFFL